MPLSQTTTDKQPEPGATNATRHSEFLQLRLNRQ